MQPQPNGSVKLVPSKSSPTIARYVCGPPGTGEPDGCGVGVVPSSASTAKRYFACALIATVLASGEKFQVLVSGLTGPATGVNDETSRGLVPTAT